MAQTVKDVKTFTAGEAVAVHRRVKLSSGSGTQVEYCDGGYDAIGNVVKAAANGAAVGVRLDSSGQTVKCVASEAIAAGAAIYAAADGKVSDTADAHGAIGKALGAATANNDVIECHIDRAANMNVNASIASGLHVMKGGNDTTGTGAITSPFLTIIAALAAVTSAIKHIFVWPGTYTEAAAIVWPTTVSGIHLIGMGHPEEVVVTTVTGETEVLNITPGAQGSTFEVFLENILIDAMEAGQIGIQVENASMTKKLIVYGQDVEIHMTSSGNSIDVDHGDTSNAIRFYWRTGKECTIEGVVDWVAADNGDKLHFWGYHLEGGITTDAGAFTLDIICRYCEIMDAGIVGGHGSQTFLSIFCVGEDGALFATGDVATQTDTIVGS